MRAQCGAVSGRSSSVENDDSAAKNDGSLAFDDSSLAVRRGSTAATSPSCSLRPKEHQRDPDPDADGWPRGSPIATVPAARFHGDAIFGVGTRGRLFVAPWPSAMLLTMARVVGEPAIVQSAGNKPKRIEEFFGLARTRTGDLSLARMTSPTGWREPGQTPEFDEYTLVLRGTLRVETRQGATDVRAGEAVHAPRGEWVRYSTPHPEGAEYVAVCVPAFTPGTVHRDPE
jgi:quercetin dioxygenase-like cupin family protein